MDLAAAELTAYGVEPGTFHAQQLSVESVAAADLVLTTELGHRADVVPLVPGALRAAFTLREFARLLPAARLREPPGGDPVARAVGRRRGQGRARLCDRANPGVESARHRVRRPGSR